MLALPAASDRFRKIHQKNENSFISISYIDKNTFACYNNIENDFNNKKEVENAR